MPSSDTTRAVRRSFVFLRLRRLVARGRKHGPECRLAHCSRWILYGLSRIILGSRTIAHHEPGSISLAAYCTMPFCIPCPNSPARGSGAPHACHLLFPSSAVDYHTITERYIIIMVLSYESPRTSFLSLTQLPGRTSTQNHSSSGLGSGEEDRLESLQTT